MKTEIIDNTENPPEVIATITYDGGPEVVIHSEIESFVASLYRGIYNPIIDEMVIPSDGAQFMQALPYEFKSYVSVNVVEE